jgi:hypothetical protein
VFAGAFKKGLEASGTDSSNFSSSTPRVSADRWGTDTKNTVRGQRIIALWNSAQIQSGYMRPTKEDIDVEMRIKAGLPPLQSFSIHQSQEMPTYFSVFDIGAKFDSLKHGRSIDALFAAAELVMMTAYGEAPPVEDSDPRVAGRDLVVWLVKKSRERLVQGRPTQISRPVVYATAAAAAAAGIFTAVRPQLPFEVGISTAVAGAAAGLTTAGAAAFTATYFATREWAPFAVWFGIIVSAIMMKAGFDRESTSVASVFATIAATAAPRVLFNGERRRAPLPPSPSFPPAPVRRDVADVGGAGADAGGALSGEENDAPAAATAPVDHAVTSGGGATVVAMDHSASARAVLRVLDLNQQCLDVLVSSLPAASPLLVKQLEAARAAAAAATATAAGEVGAAATAAASLALVEPRPAALPDSEIVPRERWDPTLRKNVPLDHAHRHTLWHSGVEYQVVSAADGSARLRKSPPLKNWQDAAIRWVVSGKDSVHASEVKKIALFIDDRAAAIRLETPATSSEASLVAAIAELPPGKTAALTFVREATKKK